MGKGEIARCEQFLLFPQCFQNACFPLASKGVIVWEWVKRMLILSQTPNFRPFQTERVCRRQFKFDENSRKLSKPVENTVGKGEIARYEQFLLFPQCFQKACFPWASKGVTVLEWVKRMLPFPKRQILDPSKLKELADDNSNLTKIAESYPNR